MLFGKDGTDRRTDGKSKESASRLTKILQLSLNFQEFCSGFRKALNFFLEKNKHSMFKHPREAQVSLQDRLMLAYFKVKQ